jgi:hypothetical protein
MKPDTTTRTNFTVPMFPHVRKFILKKYKMSYPVKIEEYNVLGKLVTLTLRENRVTEKYNDQYRDRLTGQLEIVLTKEQSELGPRLNKLVRINIYMDRVFKEHLISWIDAQRVAGIPPFNACKTFLQYYGIDETEYSSDAAYQYYQRSKR